MKNSSELLVVQNLSFGYNPKEFVLNDISFEIERGNYMAILGSSGSGKSTLLRILADILPQNEINSLKGNISLFGEDPFNYLGSGKLAFMFQEPSLMPNLNVKQNIAFPLKLRGENIDHSFIADLTKTIGLDEHQEKLPKELSGGMKTRVALARAFVTKPELLLLDEPFSALDISWRYELYSYLEKIKERFNTTIVLVTHDIQEAVLLANKIIVLSSEGEIIKKKEIQQTTHRHFDYEHTSAIIEREQKTILGLQTDILIDGNRGRISLHESIEALDSILERIKTKTEDDPFIYTKLTAIHNHVSNDKIAKKLIQIWEESDNLNFKMELCWRLLDKRNLDFQIHRDVNKFIKHNWEYFKTKSKNQQYFKIEELFSQIQNRIDSDDYPTSKDWLYLCYLKVMTEDTLLDDKAEDFIIKYLNNSKDSTYFEFIEVLIDKPENLKLEK